MSSLEDRQLKEVDLMLVDDEFEEESENIVRETALRITVNGRPFVTAMMLAGMEREYTVGYLYSQGYISHLSEIAFLDVDEDTVDVRLAGEPKVTAGGPVDSSLTVDHDDIFACVRAILTGPVFRETQATHSAGLFLEGKQAIAIAEDIGRHHAFDKVIGAGLLAGTDLSRTVAASTGRQSTEMITRCRNAGIPVIATKGVPTTLAVEMAEENGITIAGLVRGESMIVYSHPERIR